MNITSLPDGEYGYAETLIPDDLLRVLHRLAYGYLSQRFQEGFAKSGAAHKIGLMTSALLEWEGKHDAIFLARRREFFETLGKAVQS